PFKTGAEVNLAFGRGPLLASLFQLSRLAGRIDANIHMMRNARIAWPYLDAHEILVLGYAGRQNKATNHVGAAGSKLEVPLDRQHQVRLTELPALDELLVRRRILGIATRRAAVDPVCQSGNFAIRKLPSIQESCPFDRFPGRHLAALGERLDVAGPVHGLLVSHERKRADRAGSVTRLAALLQDRQHIAIIG